MRHFAFIYFMKPDPEAIQAAIPAHIEHWRKASPVNYRGGPFIDRTGGLITFSAESLEDAKNLTQSDPFVVNGLLEYQWLKEWMPS